MSRDRWWLIACLAAMVGPQLAHGRAHEVKLELPRPSRIDPEKEGYQKLAIAPFLSSEKSEKKDYAFEKEAARYFERLFGKETKLEVLRAAEEAPLPFRSVQALVEDKGFWQKRAQDLGVDLILTGQVGFKTSNRSGYVQNTFQSAVTGRVYYDRPTFVYRSGITLAMEVVLIEGKTGDVLYRDKFMKDRTVDGGGGDPLQNFFDLMRGLSPSVLGIVTPQKAVATRYLLE